MLDQPIAYEYTVTSSGDVTLGGTLAVADDRVTVDCDPASVSLAPGESASCSASYRVTQADLDAGSVTNTATATLDGVTSDPASATADATQAPALSLVKVLAGNDDEDGSGTVSLGDTLHWTISATNSGNVTLDVHGRPMTAPPTPPTCCRRRAPGPDCVLDGQPTR